MEENRGFRYNEQGFDYGIRNWITMEEERKKWR